MLEQEKKALGETRPESLAFHTNLIGADYRELGQLDNAAAAFREALAIWAKIQGANTEASSATPLIHLGITLALQGRYDEAESALRGGLAIQQKHELPSSQWLNLPAANWAIYCVCNIVIRKPCANLAKRLRRCRPRPGSPAANPMRFFPSSWRDSPRPSWMRVVWQRQMPLLSTPWRSRTALPSGNYRLGAPLFALARAKLALGRPNEAEPLLREALSVRNPPHPADDVRVLEVKVSLAAALAALGRNAESRVLINEVGPPLMASSSPYATDLRARLASQ